MFVNSFNPDKSKFASSPGFAMNENTVSPGCAYGGCPNKNPTVEPAVIFAVDVCENVTL